MSPGNVPTTRTFPTTPRGIYGQADRPYPDRRALLPRSVGRPVGAQLRRHGRRIEPAETQEALSKARRNSIKPSSTPQLRVPNRGLRVSALAGSFMAGDLRWDFETGAGEREEGPIRDGGVVRTGRGTGGRPGAGRVGLPRLRSVRRAPR